MENIFWNNKHARQAEYEELHKKLVPSMGAADSVAGEVLRASSNLYYDFYNNGLMNNKTGALEYLKDKIKIEDYEILEEAVIHGSVDFGNVRLVRAFEQVAEAALDFASIKNNQNEENDDDHLEYGISTREIDEIRGLYNCDGCGEHEDECSCYCFECDDHIDDCECGNEYGDEYCDGCGEEYENCEC